MYTKFSEEELKDLSQYWYSKSCNEVTVPEKKVFYDLHVAYENLINTLKKKNGTV